MTIVSKPLDIGAADLLRGVEFTLCGNLYVFISTLLGKKWKQRYAIVSQGCFYIYHSKNSRKTDLAFSMTEFESAREYDPHGGEDICFRLSYKATQMPLLFAVDTHDGRDMWIGHLSSAIEEVQSSLNKLSAESGYGSGGIVPTVGESGYEEDADEPGYDEVDERKFEQPNRKRVQPEADGYEVLGPTVTDRSNNDESYENVEFSLEFNPAGNMKLQLQKRKDHIVNESKTSTPGGSNVKKGSCKESSATGHTGNTRGQTQPKVFMDKLKEVIGNGRNGHSRVSVANKTQAKQKPDDLLINRSRQGEGTTNSKASMCLPSTESSFASVRDGDRNTAIEESSQFLSVRGAENESLYQSNGDSGNNNDSDNTSPEVIYENIVHNKFEKESYFLGYKKQVKGVLKSKPDGTFAVFPGQSTEYEVCVTTQAGLKYFPIFSQSGKLFLDRSYRGHKFSTLDDLLSHYYYHDIPQESGHSVKLKKGYKSL